MAGPLGGDHEDVQIGARLDLAEMDVKAVGEGHGGAFPYMGLDLVTVQGRLVFVRGEYHDHVRPGDGILYGFDREAGLLGLGRRGRSLAQADAYINAGVLEVVGVGVPL